MMAMPSHRVISPKFVAAPALADVDERTLVGRIGQGVDFCRSAVTSMANPMIQTADR